MGPATGGYRGPSSIVREQTQSENMLQRAARKKDEESSNQKKKDYQAEEGVRKTREKATAGGVMIRKSPPLFAL